MSPYFVAKPSDSADRSAETTPPPQRPFPGHLNSLKRRPRCAVETVSQRAPRRSNESAKHHRAQGDRRGYLSNTQLSAGALHIHLPLPPGGAEQTTPSICSSARGRLIMHQPFSLVFPCSADCSQGTLQSAEYSCRRKHSWHEASKNTGRLI